MKSNPSVIPWLIVTEYQKVWNKPVYKSCYDWANQVCDSPGPLAKGELYIEEIPMLGALRPLSSNFFLEDL